MPKDVFGSVDAADCPSGYTLEQLATMRFVPESVDVVVGRLKILGIQNELFQAQVKLDGRELPARKLVLTLELGKLPTVEVVFYPTLFQSLFQSKGLENHVGSVTEENASAGM